MAPLECTACDGDGVERIPVCRHNGPCPCGYDERDCRTCEGSTFEPCASCGPNHPAIAFDEHDDPVCADCLQGERTQAARNSFTEAA